MGKIFMRGLIALAPIAITLAVLIWLVSFLERIFGGMIERIVGPNHYFPGLGLMVAIIAIFFAGLLLNNYIVQTLTQWGERLLNRIPLVKTLYSSVADLMSFFKGNDRATQGKVVSFELDGIRLLGLITRDDFNTLPEGFQNDDVAVFVPMSYQIGGFTLMVPKKRLKPVAMSAEEGLRFMVTAGVLQKANAEPQFSQIPGEK